MPAFVVELHPVEVTATGLWCDQCQLPSAIRVRYLLVNGDTLRTFGEQSTDYCPEHDGPPGPLP